MTRKTSGAPQRSAGAAAPGFVTRVVRPAEVDQVLGCVAEWRQLEMAVDSRRRDMVAGLRSRGASWAAIGWLLGTTAEAARLRFRDLVA